MLGAFVFDVDGKAQSQAERVAAFEKLTGRKQASILSYVTWDDPFPTAACEETRRHDAIPHLTWELFFPKQDPNNTRTVASPAETGLDDVLAGKHDAYIDQFARDAKAWGGPVLLRFLHEFNGNWYVWGGVKNGGAQGGPEKVKKVWRYVVDRFRAVGATNVLWMWCPHGPTIDVPVEPWNELVRLLARRGLRRLVRDRRLQLVPQGPLGQRASLPDLRRRLPRHVRRAARARQEADRGRRVRLRASSRRRR